jgi:disulfide bond formation protein DsbB
MTLWPVQRSAGLIAIAALCLGAVATALVTQHVFDMQPCAWCVLQRLIALTIALVALLGLAWRAPLGHRLSTLTILLLSLCGVAAALWHYFVAASSSSCNLTLAERIVSGLSLDAVLPEIFQPRASCADAAVKLLGLPYPLWSLALFMLVSVAALRMSILASRRLTG